MFRIEDVSMADLRGVTMKARWRGARLPPRLRQKNILPVHGLGYSALSTPHPRCELSPTTLPPLLPQTCSATDPNKFVCGSCPPGTMTPFDHTHTPFDHWQQVIASLRRELENLEAEVEGAKAKAKEEASRRVELEIELETLRCDVASSCVAGFTYQW